MNCIFKLKQMVSLKVIFRNRFYIIALFLFLISCKGSEINRSTFLDYKFGMTYDEYRKHTMSLFYDNKITFISGLGTSAMGQIFTPNIQGGSTANIIQYKLSMPNARGGFYTFVGDVRGDITEGSSSLLTAIEYRFKWEIGGEINMVGYKQIQKALVLKYGTSYIEDSLIENDGKMYRTTWEDGNTCFSFTLDERPEFKKAEFLYYAIGDLANDIADKSKSKSVNDIKNKY